MKQFVSKIQQTKWCRTLSFFLLPVYMFLCLYTVEYLNYRELGGIFYTWGKGIGKMFFALIVFSVLSAIILLLVRKLWIYAVTLGALTVIMGLVNCVKLSVNGDYFFPWDVTMMGNMSELVSFARFDIPPFFWLWLSLMILMCVYFAFVNTKINISYKIALPLIIALILPVIIFFNNPKTTEKVFLKFGMSFNDSILQSSNYRANGFTNAFTINCFALKVSAPEGYSAQAITDILENYSETKATQSPDVIVVLSEAFWDVRNLNGTTFSQNPLKNYDKIISHDNAVSGKLYTTALGGGTVRTEFEMLTGLTVDYLINGTSPYLYIKNEIPSYVSNYKSQGYKTTAIHTYDGKFYMRNTAYPLLGFDEFISEKEIYQNYEWTGRRGYITDDTFMDVVIDTLEKNTDKPNFIFGITMENHQAYKKSNPEDIVIDVQNPSLESDVLDSVTTYTQGVYYADLSLKKLVDYIDSREKPTVLLFFGDHLPTLGSNQAAYKQAGNVSYPYDSTEQAYLFSTPFVIYSNYLSDYGVLENNTDVSTYYMLSLLARATNTGMTPYMNYLADNFLEFPYYNVRLGITLDESGKEFINSMKLITYDTIK